MVTQKYSKGFEGKIQKCLIRFFTQEAFSGEWDKMPLMAYNIDVHCIILSVNVWY